MNVERSDAEEQKEETSEDPSTMLTATSEKPAVPKSITDEEAQELKERASKLVYHIGEATGSRELMLIDSITSLGVQAQRQAGGDLELLRVRVGDLCSGDGPTGDVSKSLADLRMALNQINPHELTQSNPIRRVFGMIPLINRLTSVMRVLEKIAIRYEPVSKEVEVIETKLRDGRRMLVSDNIELRKLYEQAEAQQLPIQKNAYLGEIIMQRLAELIDDTDDPVRVERVQSIL